MTELKRLTTQYDLGEDRICLTGTDDQGQMVCLWLTQRLINRLVPHLCQGLEKQDFASVAQAREQASRSHVEQSFAQQKAQAALQRQAPVAAADDTPQWRVDSLDIKRAPGGVRLVFKGKLEAQQAVLSLPTLALRQWLGIVFEQYRRAQWPTQVWPAWIEEATAPAVKAPGYALH